MLAGQAIFCQHRFWPHINQLDSTRSETWPTF
jgi:hypothetical protein